MGYRKTVCLFALCLVLLCGCSHSSGDAALSRALEDIREPLSLMDIRLSLVENALRVAESYIDNPGEQTLEAAKRACMVSIAQIAELPSPESSLTAEERGRLIKLGLNMADYDVPFQYTDYYKHENIQTLTLLSYYLSGAPSQNEILKYVVNFNLRYQALDRKLEYIGLNDLFCKIDSKELEDFKTDYLPGLATLCADGLPWETDSAVLESKANYWFAEMEDDIDDYADFLGEQYLAQLTAKAAYTDSFGEAGYTPEETDGIIAAINALTQSAENEP